MATSSIVIYGAGGHAKVVADLVRLRTISIAGFVDDTNPHRRGEKFCGSLVFSDAQGVRQKHSDIDLDAVIAIGDCNARVRIAVELERQNFRLLILIHPTAAVAGSARIGAGTVVMAGAIINADAVIGKNVIINTGAIVEHDCVIEEGAHICPGVRLGGGVNIGSQAWIGIGAIVKDRVHIGSASIVGAGSLVLKDVPDNATVYGSPAVLRHNDAY